MINHPSAANVPTLPQHSTGPGRWSSVCTPHFWNPPLHVVSPPLSMHQPPGGNRWVGQLCASCVFTSVALLFVSLSLTLPAHPPSPHILRDHSSFSPFSWQGNDAPPRHGQSATGNGYRVNQAPGGQGSFNPFSHEGQAPYQDPYQRGPKEVVGNVCAPASFGRAEPPGGFQNQQRGRPTNTGVLASAGGMMARTPRWVLAKGPRGGGGEGGGGGGGGWGPGACVANQRHRGVAGLVRVLLPPMPHVCGRLIAVWHVAVQAQRPSPPAVRPGTRPATGSLRE